MAKDWWFKFEWDDWLGDDELSACTLESQGLWIRCIALMYRSDVAELTGTIDQLRRKLGILPEELTRCLSDLKHNNAADVRFCKDIVSIISRRRKRELKAKENNRLYVAAHREKTKCKTDVRKQSKSKSLKQEKEKKEEVAEAAPKQKRGTRLPDTFYLTSDMREWGTENRPEVDLALETKKFCNHFRAAPGQKGVKLDWRMTWENWILNARGTNGTNQQRGADNGRATSTDRLRDYGEVLDQYPTEADLGRIA